MLLFSEANAYQAPRTHADPARSCLYDRHYGIDRTHGGGCRFIDLRNEIGVRGIVYNGYQVCRNGRYEERCDQPRYRRFYHSFVLIFGAVHCFSPP